MKNMLVTDYTPLQWLMRMKDMNPRLTHWYLSLQPYAFKVQCRKGKDHANTDYFSRQSPWAREEADPATHLAGGGYVRELDRT